MPYWFVVLHDAFAGLVSGFTNGFVFFLETLGVTHETAVSLATDAIVVMVGAVVVAAGAKIRGWMKRGAEAARHRLARERDSVPVVAPEES
jgi:hypothetical protein